MSVFVTAAFGLGFAAAPADLPDADRKELTRLWSEVRTAVNGRDAAKLLSCFDLERMRERVVRHAPKAKVGALEQAEAASRLRELVSSYRIGEEEKKIEASVDQKIEAAGPNDAVAVVRFRDGSGQWMVSRYWVHRDGGKWRLADEESLPIGFRLSHLAALNEWAQSAAASPADRQAASDVAEALDGYQNSDTAKARKSLARIGEKVDPFLDGMRWMLVGVLARERERPQTVLDACTRIEQRLPGLPATLGLKSFALQRLDRDQEAAAAIQAYEKLVGADSDSSANYGAALLRLRRFRDAAAAFRRGLEADPHSADNLAGYVAALPQEKKRDALEWLSRPSLPVETMRDVGAEFVERKDANALDVLAEAARKRKLEDQSVYFAACAKCFRSRFQEAAALLAPHAAKSPAEEEPDFLGLFLDARYELKQGLPGYKAAGDREAAFEHLAGRMWEEGDVEGLSALIAEHAKAVPNDPRLDFYRAGLRRKAGRADQAAALLAEAMKKATDKDVVEELRKLRVDCMYDAGQAVKAASDVPPREKAFAELAARAAKDQKPGLLESLLAAVRSEPKIDQAERFRWEVELLWLRKDYAKAAATLQSHPERLRERAELRDRLVRSLVRLKKYDEALREAQAVDVVLDEPLYLAMVHAAAGRTAETEAALVECLDSGLDAPSILQDEDLGAALAAPKFAALRRRHLDNHGLDP